MIERTLNTAAAKALFADEAICFENSDGVTRRRAAALFGAAAVKFAIERKQTNEGRTYSIYGTGDTQTEYLTMRGFLIAATFNNIAVLRAAEDAERKKAAIDAGTSTADNGKKKCLSRQSIPQIADDVKQETAVAPRRRRTRKQSNE